MLESQQGRGVFVAEKRSLYSVAERRRRLHSALDAFVNDVLALDYTPEELLAALEERLAELRKPVSGGSPG